MANRRGWRTKERVSKSGNRTGGNRWTPRQILATLSNPVYIGQIHDGKGTRPGSHMAIVTEELFQQVAAIVQSRRSRPPGRSKKKSSLAASRLAQVRPMWPADEPKPVGIQKLHLPLLPLPFPRRRPCHPVSVFPSQHRRLSDMC